MDRKTLADEELYWRRILALETLEAALRHVEALRLETRYRRSLKLDVPLRVKNLCFREMPPITGSST